MFLNLIFGEVHIWKGSANKIMVSFEDTKTLQSFNTIDEVIEMLYAVDNTNKPIDSDRWRLLRKEFR